MKNLRRVVVCGYGAVTPLGNASSQDNTLWDALKAGQTAIRPLPFDPIPLNINARVASWIDQEKFNIRDFFNLICNTNTNPKPYRADLSVQLGLAAAAIAFNDAKLNTVSNFDLIGVQAGTGLGGGRSHEEGYKSFLEKGATKALFFTVTNVMPNALAGTASIAFGLHGPSNANTTACASGNYAICEAVSKIRQNLAKAMLVVAAESMATPFMIACFDQMKALSPIDSPYASQPFGANRTGFVMGEGAGALVLADLEWAEANHLPILAEILGYAENSGSNDMVQPSALGAAECMSLALEDACVNTSSIDYINTHGTATGVGDAAESEAIWQVFISDTNYVQAPELPLINSSKALLGHTLGAAGLLEAIVGILSIRDNLVHPMSEYPLDPVCVRPPDNGRLDIFKSTLPIVTAKSDRQINIVMSNSFGFGDHNSVLIIKRL